MKAKLFSALKYLLFLGIGLSILFFVFKDKDLEKMLVDLKNAEYKWLVFSMVFGYAAYLFRALRWLLLLETMNYKTSANHATQAVAAGYFANIIFPRVDAHWFSCGFGRLSMVCKIRPAHHFLVQLGIVVFWSVLLNAI